VIFLRLCVTWFHFPTLGRNSHIQQPTNEMDYETQFLSIQGKCVTKPSLSFLSSRNTCSRKFYSKAFRNSVRLVDRNFRDKVNDRPSFSSLNGASGPSSTWPLPVIEISSNLPNWFPAASTYFPLKLRAHSYSIFLDYFLSLLYVPWYLRDFFTEHFHHTLGGLLLLFAPSIWKFQNRWLISDEISSDESLSRPSMTNSTIRAKLQVSFILSITDINAGCMYDRDDSSATPTATEEARRAPVQELHPPPPRNICSCRVNRRDLSSLIAI